MSHTLITFELCPHCLPASPFRFWPTHGFLISDGRRIVPFCFENRDFPVKWLRKGQQHGLLIADEEITALDARMAGLGVAPKSTRYNSVEAMGWSFQVNEHCSPAARERWGSPAATPEETARAARHLGKLPFAAVERGDPFPTRGMDQFFHWFVAQRCDPSFPTPPIPHREVRTRFQIPDEWTRRMMEQTPEERWPYLEHTFIDGESVHTWTDDHRPWEVERLGTVRPAVQRVAASLLSRKVTVGECVDRLSDALPQHCAVRVHVRTDPADATKLHIDILLSVISEGERPRSSTWVLFCGFATT